MSNLKVAYFVPGGFGYSGREKQVRLLCEEFSEIDFLVIHVYEGLFEGFLQFYNISKKYDTIIVAGIRRFALYGFLFKIFNPSCRLIYQSTNMDYDDPEYVFSSPFFRVLFSSFHIHIAQIQFRRAVNNNAIFVPNFVRLIPDDLVEVVSVRTINFINIGAICPRKNQNNLINELLSAGITDSICFVGPDADFYECDLNYVEHFKRLCFLHGHRFLGKLEHDVVISLLCDSRFLLVSSINEGASNVYLEAMAVGCIPVISSLSADVRIFQSGGFKAVSLKELPSRTPEELQHVVDFNRSILFNSNMRCLDFYSSL